MTRTQDPVPCRRFPCDTAFHGGTHIPTRHGEVLHEVYCGHEARHGVDDEVDFPLVWSVRTIAWDDDGPWQPYVYVENSGRTFIDPAEATRFAENVHTATMRALRANLEEGTRSAARLRSESQGQTV